MGLFWEIENLMRQIKALNERALYFPEDKEYCQNKIDELKRKLEELHNVLKNG